MNITESLFSTIPVKYQPTNQDRKYTVLLHKWKPYQYKKPTEDEISLWDQKYPDRLTGIVTGKISNVLGLDFDTREAYEYYKNRFPEINETAGYNTNRGFHSLFRYIVEFQQYETIKLDLFYEGYKAEAKGNGCYLIAPPSIVDGIKREWINPPTRIIQPPPELVRMIIEKKDRPAQIREQMSKQPGRLTKPDKWPPYKGTAKCIRHILRMELVEGERYIGLFVLYNLLLKHNSTSTARYIVQLKNRRLQQSLNQDEINHIFEKDENYYFDFTCEGVVMNLSYIPGICGQCHNLDLKGNKLLNEKTIDRLTNEEFIALQYKRFGYSIRKASRRMNKSPSSVSEYLTNARKKLGIEPVKRNNERIK